VEIFSFLSIINQLYKTEETSLITKPMPPITATPNKHILIDSQSSVLPGFVASFSNLDADVKNVLIPNLLRHFKIEF
jgi:hypothetical protein